MAKIRQIEWADIKAGILRSLCFMVSIGLVLMLTSCDKSFFEGISDDDSYDARLEKGIQALDDEEYGKAIKIFEDLRDDYSGKAKVCEYLSSAYSGYIGLDTFSFLETIDKLEDEDSGNIAMVGLVLGDDIGNMTKEEVTIARDYLGQAISTFIDCLPDRNDDQKVQLGLIALFDVALAIAEIVIADLDLNDIVLTEDGLAELYEPAPADFDDVDDGLMDNNLTDINADLIYIEDSVAALVDISGGDSDLAESFSAFIELLDDDGDSLITETELEDYINHL